MRAVVNARYRAHYFTANWAVRAICGAAFANGMFSGGVIEF